MSKIFQSNIRTSLFDLSQDIIGNVPFGIIDHWVKSDQSLKTATQILEPTKVRGISVSSDSSGLSKLSKDEELIKVLALISKPKEYVYNAGLAIGGRSVGIWAADNTQMFYDDAIAADKVLSMLWYLQNKVINNLEVKIGLGAHYGEFYDIGGGLYGEDADFIEGITENQTGGGEIVITEQLVRCLSDPAKFHYQQRTDITHRAGKVFSLLSGPDFEVILPEKKYPIPYSHTFFEDIRKVYDDRSHDLLNTLNQKHLIHKVIVLIEREREVDPIPEIALLNDIALYAFMEVNSSTLLKDFGGEEIKTVGAMGIYVFDDSQKALEYSIEFREFLLGNGMACKIGLAEGSVIIFELQNGTKDIAGDPVNIASKISQDKGEMGMIYLTEELSRKINFHNHKINRISYTISDVFLEVVEVSA